MTDHTRPSLGLVEQWLAEVWHEGTPVAAALSDMHIATRAAEWGAALAAEPPAPAGPEEYFYIADPIREALKELVEAINEQFFSAAGLLSQRVIKATNEADRLLVMQQSEPPAPDPREALAARPLLEAVMALEVFGGPLPALQQRISAWLRENPPGQPVAIEPRGCPAPGACSCVEPPAPAEPDTDAVLALAAIIRRVGGWHSLGAAALAEAILAHPNAANVFQPPAPAPAADGEREELAQWLEDEAVYYEGLSTEASAKAARAAALLRQSAPAPLRVVLPEEPPELFHDYGGEAYLDGYFAGWAAAHAEVERQQGGQADG